MMSLKLSNKYDTINSLVLALLLDGREVTTPAMTYSISATRLPAYIDSIESKGLDGYIVSEPMPLTQRQIRRNSHKPFHRYYIPAHHLVGLRPVVLTWVANVLSYWLDKEGLKLARFPVRASLRGTGNV